MPRRKTIIGSIGLLGAVGGVVVMLKKLPGKRKPPTLTLKRGKNQSMDLG